MRKNVKKSLNGVVSLLLCGLSFSGCALLAPTESLEQSQQSEKSEQSQQSEPSHSSSLESGDSSSSGTGETAVRYWRDTKNFGIDVRDGVMYLGEEMVYQAGVNCYNLFNQCFANGYSSKKAKETLDILADYGIKVVRFNCGGYASDYINGYFAHKTAYINLLREIAEYAETLEIGLIPSFFWLYHAVPDYYDEPIRAWGDADSATVAFLEKYTEDVVRALKDYKAIFAWEFGNEFNLSCDLPNAAEHMPALPTNSKRTKRTEEDYLSAADVQFALTKFSESILRIDDTGRMITSGNATMRPSQYHQFSDNTWAQDSVLEFKKITAMFAPDGVDTVCEHVYFTSQKTFGQDLTLAEYLQYATANAKALNKAYFVGEWGGGTSNERAYYSEIGNAFVEAGVQLALLWNFNVVENSVEYSFSADTERGQMLLEVIEEMNLSYDEKY